MGTLRIATERAGHRCGKRAVAALADLVASILKPSDARPQAEGQAKTSIMSQEGPFQYQRQAARPLASTVVLPCLLTHPDSPRARAGEGCLRTAILGAS